MEPLLYYMYFLCIFCSLIIEQYDSNSRLTRVIDNRPHCEIMGPYVHVCIGV